MTLQSKANVSYFYFITATWTCIYILPVLHVFFLFDNFCRDSDKKLEVLQEAETRLNNLVEKNFKAIAIELEEHDPYLYLRAYTSGLQEFVEALLFFWYLKADLMKTWSEINETFVYKRDDEQQDKKSVMLLFPEVEFILGIGDFTGELMRKCINSLGTGNIEDCFKICNFVKDLYTGFLGTRKMNKLIKNLYIYFFSGVNNIGYKEFNHKMYVLKQSVMKMELVCYNIRVRGSEVPKHMLVNVLSSGNKEHDEDDEGFF